MNLKNRKTGSPMHIVHVAGSAQWAGGEVFLRQMAERLDRNRFSMSVICPERGPLEDEMARRNIACEAIPFGILGNPFPLLALRRAFRRMNADVVQSHGARSNFYARLASGAIPHVSTIHNSLDDYPVSIVRKGMYKMMDGLSAGRSARLVFVAEALRKNYAERSPGLKDRMHVFYNGVDTDVFNPQKYKREEIRKRLGLKPVWTLGILGRMTQQKGHIYLLEALRRSLSILPSFQLLIIGDGPLRPWLEKRSAEYGLRSFCQFMGVRQDIPEILAALDVVVMPSVSEGFPYVLLEALAMGRPTVAADVNGVSEIMVTGEEGYRVPPRSADRLEEALSAILANPREAQRRAEVGRNRVLEHFGLSKTIRNWEKLYVDLASSSGVS